MTNQQLFFALLSSPSPDMLAEYARANVLVVRCPICKEPYLITLQSGVEYIIQCDVCEVECDRLLTNGQWQSAEERQLLNQSQLERNN